MNVQDKNMIQSFNVGLVASMLLLFGLGITTLISATKGPGIQALYRSQLVYFALGIVLMAVLVFLDGEIFEMVAYFTYGICLVLLVLVLIIGKVGGGSQRWIPVGPIHIQPSEFAKIAIVFTLAKYFRNEKVGPPYTLKALILPGLMVAPFFVLILLQPDLGTAGVLSLVAASMVLFVGVHWRSLVIVVVLGLVTVPIAYRFVLKDYQRERVKTFLDPGRDAKGSGYNALQCRIAVGSGKVFGKGYLRGTQAQLNFIPEQHTDFIFSVYAEERGFIGTLLLVLLYGSYLFYALQSVLRARDKFQMLLAFGLASIIFWHAFINIGMVSGILPIVGVGLPFFSFGGSALWTFMFCTAILLNVGRKKFIF